MNTHPSKPIGFRSTQPWGHVATGRTHVGWRFWIGPLIVARTPGISVGVTVGWTR
jgi:hypothetical protein